MAENDSKSKPRSERSDPTIRSDSTSPEYPEGTHPIAPIEEQAWSPERFVVRDNPDKPHPSSVAQVIEEKD